MGHQHRIYATTADHKCTNILDEEERAADATDRESTIDRVNNVTGIDDPVCLANHLYANFMFHTTGEGQKIVTNVDDSNGTEAWRKLVRCERTFWTVAHDTNTIATASDEAQRLASNDRGLGGDGVKTRQDESHESHQTFKMALIINMYLAGPTSSHPQLRVQKLRGDWDGNARVRQQVTRTWENTSKASTTTQWTSARVTEAKNTRTMKRAI